MTYSKYIGPIVANGKISPRLSTVDDLITIDDVPVTKHALILLNKSFDVDKINLDSTGKAIPDAGSTEKTLKHMSMYDVTVDAATGFDFSNIQLATPESKEIDDETVYGVTTARLKITIPAGTSLGTQTWPTNIYWMSEYDHAAPVLEQNYCHFISLEYDGTKTCANISHYYPLS